MIDTAPLCIVNPELEESWIDWNGHLSDGYYAVVMIESTDKALACFGVTPDYPARTGRSVYTGEIKLRYLAEVKLQDALRTETYVGHYDEKRVTLHHQLYREDHNVLAAEMEVLCLSVDLSGPKVCPFEQMVMQEIHERAKRHSYLASTVQSKG
ncbi:MAG: thioesterase family protein [Pseudomonadota bacterium]|uniref:thioesterase family protein n=1 Tax=Fodinicurvata fenggangensis TaxID=1121830 RepID=UPI00138E3666|nr:thioesterase family protein [Fodinicurvata fenggangensis]